MRRALILLLAVLVGACGTNTPSNQPKQVTEVANASPAPTLRPTPTSKQFPLPEVKNVTQEMVWRESDNKGDDGDLPPWKKINIDARLNEKPEVGEKVTVVPLDVEISPFDLKILKLTEENKSCDQKKHVPWWLVELEEITRKEFFEIKAIAGRREEYPFDVCVIHPAVEFARQLKKEQLTKKMIPAGISINTVTAAIDLTNDQEPDVLVVLYCCRDTTKEARDCDYTCGKIFKKTRNGWKLIEEHQPC
ncbi:MAG TPA: hypothetical protein VF791_17675 [Pyrinomonadaceae bacterium]